MRRALLLSAAAALMMWQHSYSQSMLNSTGGPYGGNVTSLSSSSNGTIYAAVSNQGIYSSTDFGMSWTHMSSGLSDSMVTSFISTANCGLFAGTQSSGLYSLQNGSFIQTGMGQLGSGILSLQSSSSGSVYAVTNNGVYSTSDCGATWTAMNTGLNGQMLTSLSMDAAGNLFGTSQSGGLYAMMSGVNTWLPLSANLGFGAISSLAFAGDSTLFIGTSSGLRMRTGLMGTWDPVTNDTLAGSSIARIYTGAQGRIYVATHGNGIFMSNNGGLSFQSMNSGLNTRYVTNFTSDMSGTLYAGTQNGGVAMWDAANMTWKSIGVSALNINSLASANGTLYAGSTYGGLFSSTNAGQTWSSANLTDTAISTIGVGANNMLYVATQGGGVYSMGAGQTGFTSMNTGLDNATVGSFAFDQSGNTYAATNSGIYSLGQGSSSWSNMSAGLTGTVRSVNVGANGQLYALTNGGVYTYNTGSSSWTAMNEGLSGAGNVSSIFTTGTGASYAVTQNGVYSMQSGGTMWQSMNTGLEGQNVMAMTQGSASGNLYAISSGGIYMMTPGSNSWTRVATTGTAGMNFNTLAVDESQAGMARIFAGSRMNSVFSATVTLSSVEDEIALGASLGQNNPNPVLAQTEVRFTLLNEETVTLKIYNELGNEVKTVLNTNVPAGEHRVVIDAQDLSSGMYVYRLSVGRGTTQKSMIVLK